MSTLPDPPKSDSNSFPRGIDPTGDDIDAMTEDSHQLLFRRYQVRRELGRGGMGIVLLAHDTALDIPVAVKLVPDLIAKDTEAIADLRKEVLRGMALNHDGVVRTHHFEKDEFGAGIVMEFVEGHTLTELKTQQPGGCFDPVQILPWLEQLCAVLDYAHREKRIIHRDLKPRNVMIDRSGRLKVADFGIAAVVSDSMSRHSMEGNVSGTLSYMSPQQAQGMKPSHLDDLHALGATLYELLTGKPPFFRGNPAAIHAMIISVVPPGMTARREELEITGKLPIPPAWEQTVAACLAKNPADRPQSAGEVLSRLKTPLQDGSASFSPRPFPPETLAPPPSAQDSSESAQNPTRPARWPWAAAIASLALAASAAYYFTTDNSHRLVQAKPFPLSEIASKSATSAPPEESTPHPSPASTPLPTKLAPAPTPTLTAETEVPSPTHAPTTPSPALARPAELVRLRIPGRLYEDESPGLEEDGPFGFIDQTGTVVIDRQFDLFVGPFSDGFARLGSKDGQDEKTYIDQSGKLLSAPQWIKAWAFSEGLAAVAKKSGPDSYAYGFVDHTGSFTPLPTGCSWDAVFSSSDGLFTSGLAPIRRGTKAGFVDRTGKIVIDPEWDSARGFRDGLASVRRDGLEGYINPKGAVVIEPQWPEALRFSDGLALVRRDSDYGYINRGGHHVIPMQRRWSETFRDGLAAVNVKGKWGYLDTTGEVAIPPSYEWAWSFTGSYAAVRKPVSGKLRCGLIDQQGRVVVPLEWEEIEPWRLGEHGPVYHKLIKATGLQQGTVVWLDPALKEIWRESLPLARHQ